MSEPRETVIQDLAERKNPYEPTCRKRHLWSEGFIAGVKFSKTDISTQRILGEFIGTLEGVTAWDIPEPLKKKLEEKIKALQEK